ncbi:MAG: hypothetical protein EPN82_12285 [Bacteroidetes bacterium]|nr:MAG: hypothetical protein EPN82_12285 [Bacteroidota bacterium]
MKMRRAVLSFLLITYFILFFTSCGGDNNPVTPPAGDPVIDSLSKTHGEIGAIIDIFGKNFGSSKENVYAEFSGARTSSNDILNLSDKKLTVKVPVNAKTGKLFVNSYGKNSNQVDFTVDAVASSDPYIDNINPTTFSLGATLEINGRNFGANQMASYVEFARGIRPSVINNEYKSWSDIKIVITIPSAIDASGKLFVMVNGKKTNEVDYKITGFPFISDVTPDSVHKGDTLTISGSGFGNSKGTSYVNFGGYQGQNYQLWSDGTIKVQVPLNLTTDTIEVRRSDGKRSNKYYVKILAPELPAPTITNINPNPATNGQSITITGNNFGDSKYNSSIKINDVTCTNYISWTNTQILVTVPLNATSGDVIVTVNNKESNAFNLTIQPPPPDDPVIDYLDIQSANEGQLVGINGKNFGATQGTSYVEFNGINATSSDYVSWSDKRIIVRVPIGTTSGPVKVHVDSKTSNGVNLNILAKNYIIETVLIPAGEFMMGKDSSEVESPKHQVTISNPFLMGKYEVSVLEWKTVMDGSDPSYTKIDKNPVEQVSWYKVIEFCNRLSKIVGLDSCYTINGETVTCDWNANGFRLPTEAEWEYACRAGTTGNWSGNIDEIGWTSNNSDYMVHNVGTKEPNDFGLYDMHGNILEWCWDWYDPEYYKSRPNPDVDPRGPSVEFPEKVVRGGTFSSTPAECASPKRDGRSPIDFSNDRGFRVVRKK